METDRIELKTLALSLAAILIIEWVVWLLHSRFANTIILVNLARCLDIIFLLIIGANIQTTGIRSLGIDPKRIQFGLYRGLLWAISFGLLVLLVAILLFIANMNPLTLLGSHHQMAPPQLLLFLLTGCLISPVAEELFFRGIIYGFFRRWGMWVALLLSSLTFVLAHAMIDRVPLTQIVGAILFALAYEKEKNLLVPITIHVLGNTAIFSLMFLNPAP